MFSKSTSWLVLVIPILNSQLNDFLNVEALTFTSYKLTSPTLFYCWAGSGLRSLSDLGTF